ncbi:unnamed protein product, partial [Staurois parvus]
SCVESREYRGRGHLSGGFLVLGGSIISLCPSENSSITPYSSSSSLYSSLTSIFSSPRIPSERSIIVIIYLMMVRDGVTFLCGIPGIQRTGTSLWW